MMSEQTQDSSEDALSDVKSVAEKHGAPWQAVDWAYRLTNRHGPDYMRRAVERSVRLTWEESGEPLIRPEHRWGAMHRIEAAVIELLGRSRCTLR